MVLREDFVVRRVHVISEWKKAPPDVSGELSISSLTSTDHRKCSFPSLRAPCSMSQPDMECSWIWTWDGTGCIINTIFKVKTKKHQRILPSYAIPLDPARRFD